MANPQRHLVTILVIALLAAFSAVEAGEPRQPLQHEVLQRLPAGSASRALAPLRVRLATHPDDSAALFALAQGYLDIGRAQEDPRYVSYALTTVSPLLSNGRDDVEALILAATAQQYLHRFEAAQQLLGRALLREPQNAQAQLIRAGLLEVSGDLRAARASCALLLGRVDTLIALTCLSSVASRSGELDNSFQRLQQVYAASPPLPAAVDVWILGVLAEMAGRRGDLDSRARYLSRALLRAPEDPKVKAQYADLLLARADYSAVSRLLRDNEQQDGLLLRLAIAATREQGASDPKAARLIAAFEERLNAAGDQRHQREAARFLLEVRNDPRNALRAARENWQRQREPEDLRLLLAAAQAARQPDAAAEARAWIDTWNYEDRSLP